MEQKLIHITRHCLDRFKQRFEGRANKSRVLRVAKTARPMWRKLKRRIQAYRREKGLKPIEWKSDCKYLVSYYRRAIWVIKETDNKSIVLTVWRFNT